MSSGKFVFDSYAVLALVEDEPGAQVVSDIIAGEAWIRWALYFRRHLDLLKALQLAEYLSRPAAVGPDSQRTARCTVQVMRARLNQLQGIPLGELAEVFGYVGRWLEWLNQESRL